MVRALLFLFVCVLFVSADWPLDGFEDESGMEEVFQFQQRRLEELESKIRLDKLRAQHKLTRVAAMEDARAQARNVRKLEDEEMMGAEMGSEVDGSGEIEGMSAKSKANKLNKKNKRNDFEEDDVYYPQESAGYGDSLFDSGRNNNGFRNNGNGVGGYPNNNYNNNNYPNNNNNNNNGWGNNNNNNNNGWGNNNNNNGGWGNNGNGNGGIRMCCQECRRGDISCLSNCDRVCTSGKTCNKAGEGAYAAFCQQACPDSVSGFAAGDVYLPVKACEGECSAQVQELCEAHSCRDFGCVARNCQQKAPLLCRMT